MFYKYFLLLFLGHIIGDFYIQTKGLAEDKLKSLKALLIHGLLYSVAMVVPIMVFTSKQLWIITAVTALSHLMVDFIKSKYITSCENNQKCGYVFFVDQTVHLVIIAVAAFFMAKSGYRPSVNKWLADIIAVTGFEYMKLLKMLLLILFNAKPANILIKQVLGLLMKEKSEGISGAGAYIGAIERWSIVILFVLEQYELIGFIIAAKSIARHKKLDKPDFAEYYLVGTLLSVLCAIVSVSMLKAI